MNFSDALAISKQDLLNNYSKDQLAIMLAYKLLRLQYQRGSMNGNQSEVDYGPMQYSDLPPELRQEIFEYLDPQDWRNMSRVSRQSQVDYLELRKYGKLYSWQNVRVQTLLGHANRVRSAEFSPDGTLIVTASNDGTAKIWLVETGELIHTLSGHNGVVRSAQFSPDGNLVVTASNDGTAKIWDVKTGALIHTLSGHTNGVRSAQFSPDGTLIVTASNDGTAKIWLVETGLPIHTLSGHSGWVTSARFSPDGTLIVTASNDGTAKIWLVETGKPIHTLSGHERGVTSAQFSSDGTLIVTGSDDGTAKIWSASTGARIHTLWCDWVLSRIHPALLGELENLVNSAEFSPDGTLIVTGTTDGTAKIWDVKTGEEIHTLRAGEDAVRSARFSPDGTLIVTGTDDQQFRGEAKIWSASTGALIRTLPLPLPYSPPNEPFPPNAVTSVQFSPDGTKIVTASADGTAKIWST